MRRWALFFAVLGGCGGDPLALDLVIRDGTEVPPRASLLRLEGSLHRCEAAAPQTFALPTSGAESERKRLELDAEERFSVELNGYQACATQTCVAPEGAALDACVCTAEGAERRVSRACSPWTALGAESTELNLRLGPVDDRCPVAAPVDCAPR